MPTATVDTGRAGERRTVRLGTLDDLVVEVDRVAAAETVAELFCQRRPARRLSWGVRSRVTSVATMSMERQLH
jgi:hypothetical protein